MAISESTVYHIIHEVMGAPVETLTPETTMESLKADSLDIVELNIAFEEEFNVEVPDDVFTEQSTVADIVAYLNK